MNENKAILLILLIFTYSSIFSQKESTITITGKITSADDNSSLPGVTVVEKGTNNGAISSFEGEYTITAPNTATLVFSFVGYETQEISIRHRTVINVIMRTTSEQLDEVVVVAYNTQTRRELTSSYAVVDRQDITNTGDVSVTEGLQGRVAGVYISSSEGSPGSGMSVQIRGLSSLEASNEPLYIIDGVPIEVETEALDNGLNDEGTTVNPLADYPIEDIESITILKDATATALYGSRAANGVVIITTKRGLAGKAQINFKARYGVQSISKKLDLLDSYQFIYMKMQENGGKNYNFDEHPIIGSIPTKDENGNIIVYEEWKDMLMATGFDTTNTNWQDEMYRMGAVQDYYLNINGGSDNTVYNVGAGYLTHTGIIQNTLYEKYTLKSRLNFDINSKLKADLSVIGSYTRREGAATGGSTNNPQNKGIVQSIVETAPLRSPDYQKELEYYLNSLNDGEDDTDDESGLRSTNPYNFAYNVTNIIETTNLVGNLRLSYTITDHLTFRFRSGIVKNFTDGDIFFPYTTGQGYGSSGGGTLGKAVINRNSTSKWDIENILNYDKVFNRIHKLDLMVGFTMEKNNQSQRNFQFTGFGSDDVKMPPLTKATDFNVKKDITRMSSLMGTLLFINYGLKKKYYFTLSGRVDGSSRFSEGNKWGLFYSGAVAWRLGDEDFIKDLNVFSDLKIRSSLGYTGNQRITPNASLYTFTTDGRYTTGENNSNNQSGYLIDNVPNNNLTWQTTEQLDVGLDMGLFENKMYFVVDVFQKITSDLLVRLDVPIYSTGTTRYFANVGNVENKGLEISFKFTPVAFRNFKWNNNFNISFIENKVLSLNGGTGYLQVGRGNTTSRIIVGEGIGIWYGYVVDGIYQSEEEIAEYLPNLNEGSITNFEPGRAKYKDLDGNGYIDENDRTVIGRSNPKHFGGFSSTFTYKNFSLNVYFQWVYGTQVYNNLRQKLELDRNSFSTNASTRILEFWRPTVYDEAGNVIYEGNPNTDVNALDTDISDGIVESRYIEDNSFLRFQTVNVSYQFPKKWIKKANINQLNVFLRGDNLYVWTKYLGYDPEVNQNNGENNRYLGAIDRGAHPRSRTISMGVNINF